MRLGVKVIHCAERDTQVADPRKRRFEFVNTWSVDGFIGEGSQPCELGWGSHEKHFPPDGQAARVRLQGRDLSDAARRIGESALVDADSKASTTAC